MVITKGLDTRKDLFENCRDVQGFDDSLIVNKCIFNYGIFQMTKEGIFSKSDKQWNGYYPSKDDYIVHFTLGIL